MINYYKLKVSIFKKLFLLNCMKILISGGMGFLGSHLTESLLSENHKIILISKSLSKKNNIKLFEKRIVIEKINVKNTLKMEKIILKYKPDVIFHLAGQTSHSKSFENPLNDVDSDIKGTIGILEILRKNNSSCKFILGSTFVTIGKPEKLPVTENSICNPTTLYGANKLLCEHYCKIYHNLYGLNTIIFRVTNAYGPREQVIPSKNAINFLIYTAFTKQKISLYDHGKFFRDLIYISDVVSGLKTIMKKGKSGELYWISSNKKIWFYTLGKILQKFTHTQVEYVKSPTYTKKVDVGNFVASNSKLKKLGWEPKISINNGIKLTLEFMKKIDI